MISDTVNSYFEGLVGDIERQGLTKRERVLVSPQAVNITTDEKDNVLNFCANNYLGLANHPDIIHAATHALHSHGFGLASVRFICGTQDLHKALEQDLARFLRKEDAILYTSCFDANGGLFETILGADDAVISDELNHASIIDGIRLCKAARLRYLHSDMHDLESKLRDTQKMRFRLIVTDGVFSMDGEIANLAKIAELADQYDAMLMVDDSHATGFVGHNGRGTGEHCGVLDRIDIITSTLGKALGGGAGGFTAARQSIIDLLRQRSRPYLFSNSLTPALVAAASTALELASDGHSLRAKLYENTKYFRSEMVKAGFDVRPGDHPIVPIMLYDAVLAQKMAAALLEEGIYVIAFSYPVVPKNHARIRVQISAAHSLQHLDLAVAGFAKVGYSLGVLK